MRILILKKSGQPDLSAGQRTAGTHSGTEARISSQKPSGRKQIADFTRAPSKPAVTETDSNHK
jgi:hypothetical protein